jgi:glycosyltransferase involved in cell wall biosynthesis
VWNDLGMKEKKISIFSAFYPFRGGIAQFNARFYQSLERISKVKAFTFNQQYPSWLFPGQTQFVTDLDNADSIPSGRIVSTFRPWTYISAAWKLRKSNPTVYIANYWMTIFTPMYAVFNVFLPKKVKRIALLHNFIPHEKRFFDRLFNRWMVKLFDGFIVMSDKVRDDLLSVHPEARFVQLEHPWYDHFGTPMDQAVARERLGISPTKHTLLFFGIIREYKGLDLLINAMDELDSDYQLVIAGEVYGDFSYLEQLISKSKNKSNIHLFNSYISDEEVKWYFSAADVCVLPYKSATQSGVTATSFYFNVPVIATNVGGLSQSVGHEVKGLIADYPTVEALTSTIQRYTAEEWKSKCQQAITHARHRYSWDYFAKEVLEFSDRI